ncbi:serine/threonine-protein kinase BLUS1-like [Solanum tuberosum]|uniref:Kinase n=1 Tax=Solanum tuberosum TaxID=4113 RepID=M1DB08_SOLTU|nr:PREDICTED: serine/threonine-protein kinase BLUS1-like [Solanum tuberosum]
MNSRNPFTPRMEIGSSSKQPEDIGGINTSSSSPRLPHKPKFTFSELLLQEKMNSRNTFTPRMEIGSSSRSVDAKIGSSRSIIAEIGSDRSNISMDFAASLNQPRLEQTITDPDTKDTYLLNLKIGSFSNGNCPVYRAVFSKYTYEAGRALPYDHVTLKIINMNLHENEFNLIRSQSDTRIALFENPHIIRCKKTFITANLLCVCLPYMSEGSLRYILSTRPEKKLPERLIPVVLKEVLIGLQDELHVFYRPTPHNSLNAGDIFVNIHYYTKALSIKLAFETSVYDSEPPDCNGEEASSFLNPKSISIWGAAPEVFESENEDNRGAKSDIWLLGITALELVYGNLPVKNRTDFDYIINKLRVNKKFPKSLKKMMIKRDKKLKKVMDFAKRKKRVFSREFEEMVLACLRENPDDRPTAKELLKTPFFSEIERFKQFVLNTNN